MKNYQYNIFLEEEWIKQVQSYKYLGEKNKEIKRIGKK